MYPVALDVGQEFRWGSLGYNLIMSTLKNRLHKTCIQLKNTKELLSCCAPFFALQNSQLHKTPQDIGIDQSKIVIGIGRGVKTSENVNTLQQIAYKLQAAIGVTQGAIESGVLVKAYAKIGQSGKIIAPELYIALGVSGAIQHIVGIIQAKMIIAIDRNPNACIFQIADYGLVGDLSIILREIEKLLA